MSLVASYRVRFMRLTIVVQVVVGVRSAGSTGNADLACRATQQKIIAVMNEKNWERDVVRVRLSDGCVFILVGRELINTETIP